MKKEQRESLEESYNHAPEIKVAKKRLVYPVQRELWPGTRPEEGLRVRLGYFYEVLTRGIFGGRWHLEQRANGNSNGSYDACEPDVTNSSSQTHFESKGVRPGGDLQFKDFQMGKYLDMQLGLSPFSSPVIRFELYRHGIRNLTRKYNQFSKEGGKEESFLEAMVIFLAQNTLYLIDLPFSLALGIFEKGKDDKFGGNPDFKKIGRYEGENYTPLSRVYPSGLDALLLEPQEFLKEIEISPDNYTFSRVRSPKGMRINGSPITPFPILSISHKNHSAWLEGFRQARAYEEALKEDEERRKLEETLKEDSEDDSFDFGSNK